MMDKSSRSAAFVAYLKNASHHETNMPLEIISKVVAQKENEN
jgi:hypothetical protein